MKTTDARFSEQAFLSRPLPQMVYHRMKSVWEGDEWRYLICSIGSSTAKEVGDLRMYSKDERTYEAYNTSTKRWKRETIEPLTERERAILMLAGQGKYSYDPYRLKW